MFADRRILLGVTGGIAAYKAVYLARLLVQRAAVVEVIMTDNAAKFVSPIVFTAITGRKAALSLFDGQTDPLYHVESTKDAELLIIAPATADFIAKMATGLADDLLSTVHLAASCPVLIAPAMNTRMLEHPATKENMRILKQRGVTAVGPATGSLAEGYGQGRMADEHEIIAAAESLLKGKQTLRRKKILITAGGTREPIDIVRYIGNRSSGKMGYALAEAAIARGAEVTLVTAPTELSRPANAKIIEVETAEEMRAAVLKQFPSSDIVIMAAAVADMTAKNAAEGKIKKKDLSDLPFIPTKDILVELGAAKKKNQVLIGFAAESENMIENAHKKLEQKNLDVIVANDISRKDIGLTSDFNQATIITGKGSVFDTPRLRKRELAALILDKYAVKR